MIRTIAATVAVMGLAAATALADRHYDGPTKVRGTQNGAVHLGTTRHGHAPHAMMSGGKVSGLQVKKGGRDVTNAVQTKKVKTRNKKHLTEDGADLGGVDVNAAQVWVGFAFLCPGDGIWHVFWFPVDMVQGGDAGADDVG